MAALPEVSDVPLTEDVVKRPPREFSATFSEWAADNIEQIIVGKQQSGSGSTDLYIVPDNFTLFVTNATINIECTSGAPASRRGSISMIQDTVFLLRAILVAGNSSVNLSQSFPMPIKIHSGDKLKVGGFANANTFGMIKGFLLPKKISIR